MKKLGFTLAEVLITLVIIGVIAAMTVPTLMQNTEGQEYRTAFKKAISALNQALTLNYALDGLAASDYSSATELVTMFKSRMNVMEQSTTPSFTSSECSGSDVFVTTDGIMYCIADFSSGSDAETQGSTCDSFNTHPCSSGGANLWIDVNGERKPNKLTTQSSRPRDIYTAQIYSQKVIPYGDAAQEVMYDKPANGTTSTSTAPSVN